MMDYAMILTVIGFLTVLVNLIVQVVKPLTYDKVPTEILVTVLSEVLTLLAYFGYAEYASWTVTWYTVAAAVVVGLLVSYAAQFGYDKLQEALNSIHSKEENPIIETFPCTRAEYWEMLETPEMCPKGSDGADDKGKMVIYKDGMVEFMED